MKEDSRATRRTSSGSHLAVVATDARQTATVLCLATVDDRHRIALGQAPALLGWCPGPLAAKLGERCVALRSGLARKLEAQSSID